jgi:sugar phosphate isomerase/epimerase
MNIEEKSICDSLRRAKRWLSHIHFADSNRLAPGQGHVNFAQVIGTLGEIGYAGFVSIEIVPSPDQWTAAKLAIDHLRPLMG